MKIELNIYEDVDEENSDIVLGFCRNDNRKFFASGTWYKEIGFDTRFDFENRPNKKRMEKCLEIRLWVRCVEKKYGKVCEIDFYEN